MPTCTHCGDHVSQRFQRVFGDSEGRVRACPNCATGDIGKATAHRTDA